MHNYKQLDLIENALSVPVTGTKDTRKIYVSKAA